MIAENGQRHAHRWLVTVALVAVLTGLWSCSVPIGGVTGLRLTGDGHVSIVIGMCGNRVVDGVTLYEHNEATPEQSPVRGSWASSSGYTGVSWFVADSPTPGGNWSVERAWAGTVPAGRTYTVFAGSNDGSWSTYPLGFTQQDLDRLEPDLILSPLVEFGGGQADETLLTEPEFAARACKAAE